MKNFIEVIAWETNRKMLVRVSEIKYVDELENGAAKLTTQIKENHLARFYIDTKNSYAEVVEKIREATKFD